ncbi:MAG TPA: nuclear transport factor 2 family protein [Solirubrobacteraceae bacterium]|nr:nuclear transport factor 2 family protein [Solirubrobacteraceae bacterium]
MPAPRTLIAAALATAALLAACGGDDEGDVRETLDAFAEATAKKDYQRMCDDLLADELIDQIRKVNLPCEVALRTGLEDVEKPKLEIRSVKIDGDTASARVRSSAANQEPSEDVVRLVKAGDDWRIASLVSG